MNKGTRKVLFIILLAIAFLFTYLATKCEAAKSRVKVIGSCKAKTVMIIVPMKYNVSHFRLARNGHLLERIIRYNHGGQYTIEFKKVRGKFLAQRIEELRKEHCWGKKRPLCVNIMTYDRKKDYKFMKDLFDELERYTEETYKHYKMAERVQAVCPGKTRMKIKLR